MYTHVTRWIPPLLFLVLFDCFPSRMAIKRVMCMSCMHSYGFLYMTCVHRQMDGGGGGNNVGRMWYGSKCDGMHGVEAMLGVSIYIQLLFIICCYIYCF
jgi:hypothetical protein